MPDCSPAASSARAKNWVTSFLQGSVLATSSWFLNSKACAVGKVVARPWFKPFKRPTSPHKRFPFNEETSSKCFRVDLLANLASRFYTCFCERRQRLSTTLLALQNAPTSWGPLFFVFFATFHLMKFTDNLRTVSPYLGGSTSRNERRRRLATSPARDFSHIATAQVGLCPWPARMQSATRMYPAYT